MILAWHQPQPPTEPLMVLWGFVCLGFMVWAVIRVSKAASRAMSRTRTRMVEIVEALSRIPIGTTLFTKQGHRVDADPVNMESTALDYPDLDDPGMDMGEDMGEFE